jgi:hypothetical protein
MDGAERIGLRLPISENVLDTGTEWRTKFFERVLKIRDPFDPQIPEEFETHHYLTAPFKKDQKELFLNCTEENVEKLFTPAQRSMIVDDIFDRARYGDKDEQYGLVRLLSNKAFQAAFPLHDGHIRTKKGEHYDSERQVLYDKWANGWVFYKRQPLDNVRKYFGEKVGIYFAWTGHYTTWLLLASIIGIIIFLYGITTVSESRNPIAGDTCGVPRATYDNLSVVGDSFTTFYMCPICDSRCDFWYLQGECLASRASLLFDNGGTVFFAAFMSVWAVLFLEFWKRKQFILQHRWDVLGYEAAEERPRIEFERSIRKKIKNAKSDSAKAKYRRWNPVHERYELIQPDTSLYPKLIAGISGLAMLVVVVLVIVFAVLLYRIAVAAALYVPLATLTSSTAIGAGASILASITGAVIQLIGILIMNIVYKFIAVKLTDWELHRTPTQYEDSLIYKLYIFQFFNFYTSLFYIAFFRGNFVGYPGNFNYIGTVRLDECPTYGCFLELTIQLVIILLGKQILNNCVELGLPIVKYVIKRLRNWRSGEDKSTAVYTRWEKDYDLPPQDKFGLLPEYLELVVQYGFITIFVTAFPLAPLFALLNNWVEIRLDAYKYIATVRRAINERAQDMGAWYSLLEFISKLAVVSNAFLIAITSDVIPLLTYRVNTDTQALCSSYRWPSCEVSSEYSYYGGYMYNVYVQNFDIETMFNNIRLVNRGSSAPGYGMNDPGAVPYPHLGVGVYELDAYTSAANRESQVKENFIFLPWLNLTCLSNRTGLFITRQNLTADFLAMYFGDEPQNRNNIFAVEHCIIPNITCGFREFGQNAMKPNPYDTTSYPLEYWRVLTARLAFVIVFEHVIFVLVAFIAWIIPDIPEAVENEIKKEKLLALEATLKRSSKSGKNEASAEGTSPGGDTTNTTL